MKIAAAFVIGLVFGLGITVSGMINPSKVLNFFDIAGAWDPSLALVMASALTITALGYRLVPALGNPVFDKSFHIPVSTSLDKQLLFGAAVYGIGWGLIGYCPGGVLPALGLGRPEPWVFTAALIGGMAAARAVQARLVHIKTA